MTAPRHVDVGAYVLGILDQPDEEAYERHFAQCEECRREFIEMADMPAILDTLKPDKSPAQPPPALPSLSAMIDFKKPPPAAPKPPMPSVPPQQRPNGATQPHRLPMPPDRQRNGTRRTPPAGPLGQAGRTNGTTRPAPGHSRAEGTGRHNPATPPTPPRTEGTGRNAPGTSRAEGTGRNRPATPSADGTGRHAPANPRTAPGTSRAEGTGRHAPATPRTNGTGRSLPVVPRGDSATRSSSSLSPATRPTASKPAPAKPPTKRRDSGPAGRAGGLRGRKPVWLTAAAVVAVALTVGMMIGLPSGDSGNDVAGRTSAAPTAPPSGAVAGAHVVSGTDPDTGVTAIITIEPVPNGAEIDMALYEIDGPQEGTLIAVSRFGERQEVAQWRVPEGGAARGEAVRATGIAPFAQQDINRFELHGDGIAPLLVVPT